MKGRFIIFSMLAALAAGAQVPQKVNTWYEYQRFGVDSLFWIPKDTLKPPTSYKNFPYIASKNDTIFIWSYAANKWIKPYNKIFDSSLANSNVKLLANRKISGNGKDFLIDSTNSIVLRNGLYGSRLSMLPTYTELAHYDLSGTSEVIVSPLQIQLYATNRIAFNSDIGGYGFTNLPKQTFSNDYNIVIADTVGGDISQTPVSELFKNVTFGGSMVINRTLVTANTTLDNTHYYVAVDASGATSTVSISLPDVTTCPGRVYIIKKIDSGSEQVAVVAYGSDLIDGYSAVPLFTQGKRVTIVAGSVGWEILDNN